MIVFDLQCADAHGFEAWFASSSAYETQRTAGQVICPYCQSSAVEKAVMAPRISPRSESVMARAEGLKQLAALQKEMLAGSHWVGSSFAARARDIAEGSAEPATIHGTATQAEALALRDDGIGVLPLPFPVVPPEKRN